MEIAFKLSKVDPSLYVKNMDGCIIMILIYYVGIEINKSKNGIYML
jgi:hypothetical protein